MSELPKSYDPHAAAAEWSTIWDAEQLFVADPAASGAAYSIVIPPPNVTGSLHMGHALNNTLQDVLIRYKRMDGHNTVWVPGTDHAGIATQWVVRRQLQDQGIDFRDLGREGFIEKVWEWRAEAGGTITNQLRRLGVSCDWSRERFTLDDTLQRAVTEHFVRLYEQGLIYRGQRLINWDPLDQTALSDLEVDHEEASAAELWDFAYPLSDGTGEIVVSTTRPETMLGDTLVAVHPDDVRYQSLIGKTVKHPFMDRHIPIVGDAILVDMAFGTGAVKVTPAHDPNDFDTGQRYLRERQDLTFDDLFINILHADGTINGNGGPFEGMDRFDARKAVKARIAELGLERGSKPHTMNVGRSQRSGAIVEPMLSTQWFVRMKPLAGPATAAVERGFTRFVPKQWENTYYAWMRDIRDWCISRQLWWGHRIPAWYCQACTHTHVARSAPEACQVCGGTDLEQDPDVLDTWFSSALWPFSVFGWPDESADLARYYPTSVLITGFDIIFFWVARMMFAGLHFMGSVPFKDVYIHALVRDEAGQKMSKTKGNVVDPLQVIDRYGADSFRFTLVRLAAQGRDILWREERVDDAHRFTTKIWQALRYCFMNRETVDAQGNPVHRYDPTGPMEFGPYERWIQARTGAAVGRVRTALDEYRFNEAASEIHAFVWGEFCDWYLELSKTTIYDKTATPAQLNAVKHTLFETMGVIVRLFHPIMPFLSEEIWSRLPNTSGFVATTDYPRVEDFAVDEDALEELAILQEVITAVRQIRGEMKIPKKVPMRLLIADDGLRGLITSHERAAREMAGVLVESLIDKPDNVATAVVRGHELVLPLEGVVDFGAEIARLEKELAKSDKDISGIDKKLSNPGFLSKAPEQVVARWRDKLTSARGRRDTLQASLDRLLVNR